MARIIEVTKITATGDTIEYEIKDCTGLQLLKHEVVKAWVKYYHSESFSFSVEALPESVLALPVTLYLMPITWFYGVDLVVPSVDKALYDDLSVIYAAYSKIYGPFKEEWRGKITAKNIIDNKMPQKRFDNIVFFSGGVDAVHAGINHPGKKNVLVTIPSIEYMNKSQKENVGEDFLFAKTQLIRDFSIVSGSNWLLILNNFLKDVFDDVKIQQDLKNLYNLNSPAFNFDGWYGMKYLGNLLSVLPFAYAMGICNLVMGSAFEQLEDMASSNLDGANPELSDAFRISNIIFTEQDGLYIRRSAKVKNIIDWCVSKGKKTKLWTCFNDSTEQCSVCTKCMRTQFNILCAGENPKNWGFKNFNERVFSKMIYSYRYQERNLCWLWDIMDSIDDKRTYPYCNDLLHWFKGQGYQKYSRRAKFAVRLVKLKKVFKIYKYPHYMNVLFQKLKK